MHFLASMQAGERSQLRQFANEVRLNLSDEESANPAMIETFLCGPVSGAIPAPRSGL